MVHFFGIFSPQFDNRKPAAAAPGKVSFFGGVVDAAFGAVPLSRAEQDACYLNGKTWEPDPIDQSSARPYAFSNRYTP